MKGFKKNGKFRPTENKKASVSSNQIRSKKHVEKSNPESLKQRKMHSVKDIWSFEEASPELQEKIIEKLRQSEYESGDDFFADQDGLIYDKKTQLSDFDVFSNYNKKYYDLDRGQYIQFPDLVVKDEKKLFKMLGIPESLIDRVSISFDSSRRSGYAVDNNTVIDIRDNETGDTLVLNGDMDYKEYKEASIKYNETPLSAKEFNALVSATKKWDDMMHDAWVSLRDSYEHQFEDETLRENAISMGYDFDEDGNIV